MTSRACPLFNAIRSAPELRRSSAVCLALALAGAIAEIGVALSFVPILELLGIDSGGGSKEFIDQLSGPAWLLLFAGAAALRSLFNWQSSVRNEHGTQQVIVTLQTRLYRALAGAHWDAVRRLSPPAITNALQTQTYEAGYGFSSMIQAATAGSLVAGYIASAAFVFPLALPALLAALFLIWWLNLDRTNRVYMQSEDYVDATTDLHHRYEDWVAISRIASLGVDSKRLSDRFEVGAREAASHAIGLTRSFAATRVSYDFALVAGVVIGVPVAIWQDSPPALLIFSLVAFVRVLPQAATVQASYQGIIKAAAPLQAIERLVDHLETDPINRDSDHASLVWNQLELIDVGVKDTVREDGRRWLIDRMNLNLKHGEWLALTGPTGAGKTTLAEVMLMLIRQDAGTLKIDGRSVDNDIAELWRNQAAYVPQDVVLFDASIRDNLKLYVPTASDEELKKSLKQAASEFVWERLPEGLDTRVGPGGRWLSGGERQRIGIARALLPQPGFLVLDEPTAALDTDTQEALMAALSKLDRSMSVLLITHRSELIRLADRVIEIVDGRISCGSFDLI